MSAPFLWQMIPPSSPGAIMTEDKKAILALTAEVAALQAEVARLREENARLRAKLAEWEAGAHADETGHLHLCAKVNGGWHCKPGCAKAKVERLRAALRGLVEATQNEMTARGLPVEWAEDSALERACAALR